MSGSSPNKSLPAFGSSADLGVEADGNSKHSHRSGKKAESKRRKKERKERERMLNLAEQQAADGPMEKPEHVAESSRFAEIWDSQEHTIATEWEPETHMEELADSPDIVAKKRKRQSRTQTADGLERKSKKRKNPHDETNDIATEQDESLHNHAIDKPEVLSNNETNLNDLAEKFYSGRKRGAYADAADRGSGIAAEAGPGSTMDGMDVKGRIASELDGSALLEKEPDNGAEVSQSSNDGANPISGALPKDSNGSVHDAHGNEPITGIMPAELVGHREQSGVRMNGEAIASQSNGDVYDDIEVPSSVPHPDCAGNSTAKRSARQKRVAKRDFFSRLEDATDENASSQSPSAAALRRKGTKGKRIAASEDETVATPPIANGKAERPKTSSLLRSSPTGDNTAMTPSADSARRKGVLRTPRTVSGALSDLEIRNLTQAMERFRDEKKMTQTEVNELIHRNPKHRSTSELWERLVEACPNQSRHKVINQARRKFHNFVARGTWTREQDKELRRMFEQHGNKYSMIGHAINRHPEDIRDRIRNYVICGDNLRKAQWDEDETRRLIAIVEDAITEIRRMRPEDDDRPVDDDINWQLVSLGMDRTRSRLQCIAKWKALKRAHLNGGSLDCEVAPLNEIIRQARNTASTMSYRNRSVVIKAILESGASTDSRIPWLKVNTELGGQWTRALLMVVWVRLRRTLPNWQSLTVQEICTLLLQRFQNTHQLEYPSETSTADEDAEYREIEYKLQKGQTRLSAAFISKESNASDGEGEEQDRDGEEAAHEQPDAAAEEAAEEPETSQESRPHSIDLGTAAAGDREREIEDSEPEAKYRSHEGRRRRPQSSGGHLKPKGLDYHSDNQSSDTNASQVSSIPAR